MRQDVQVWRDAWASDGRRASAGYEAVVPLTLAFLEDQRSRATHHLERFCREAEGVGIFA